MIALSHLRAQVSSLSSQPRRLLLAASIAAAMVLGPAAALAALTVAQSAAVHPASAPQMVCQAGDYGCAPVRLA